MTEALERFLADFDRAIAAREGSASVLPNAHRARDAINRLEENVSALVESGVHFAPQVQGSIRTLKDELERVLASPEPLAPEIHRAESVLALANEGLLEIDIAALTRLVDRARAVEHASGGRSTPGRRSQLRDLPFVVTAECSGCHATIVGRGKGASDWSSVRRAVRHHAEEHGHPDASVFSQLTSARDKLVGGDLRVATDDFVFSRRG